MTYHRIVRPTERSEVLIHPAIAAIFGIIMFSIGLGMLAGIFYLGHVFINRDRTAETAASCAKAWDGLGKMVPGHGCMAEVAPGIFVRPGRRGDVVKYPK